jgi:argininosuccinate lyase
MQEDKEPIFDSAETLRASLEVTTGAIATLRVGVDRMREAADDPMLLATDLAEALVRAGVPFRDAHETVGRIVGHVTSNRLDLRSLTREDLAGFHEAFTAGCDELLDIEASFEARRLVGGTARARVVEELERTRGELDAALGRLAGGAAA